MEKENLTVGMVYDLFDLGGGDTCAFKVYDKNGVKCLWRKTSSVLFQLPELTEEQRALKVLRISVCASSIYLDVDSDKYRGPYIHNYGEYF